MGKGEKERISSNPPKSAVQQPGVPLLLPGYMHEMLLPGYMHEMLICGVPGCRGRVRNWTCQQGKSLTSVFEVHE